MSSGNKFSITTKKIRLRISGGLTKRTGVWPITHLINQVSSGKMFKNGLNVKAQVQEQRIQTIFANGDCLLPQVKASLRYCRQELQVFCSWAGSDGECHGLNFRCGWDGKSYMPLSTCEELSSLVAFYALVYQWHQEFKGFALLKISAKLFHFQHRHPGGNVRHNCSVLLRVSNSRAWKTLSENRRPFSAQGF